MKKTTAVRVFSFLCLTACHLQTFCQEKAQTLFDSKEVLPITITANLKPLLKDRGDSTNYHFANLSYSNEQGEKVNLPIKAKVRGNWRRASANCSFPPLLINFGKKSTKKTLFAHQNKLKLVTKCQTNDYVAQEYMVYGIYNLITDLSFKARIAKVTYTDSLGKRKPETDNGFFLEDEHDVAQRNDAKNEYRKNLPMQVLDPTLMLTVAMFEYMIGNNDWSVSGLHNIKIYTKNNKFLPVPYDFDHAGIVETSYAQPPPQLELSSVRERLYRGLNYKPETFQAVFDKFNMLKPQIYALYQGNPMLNAFYVKRTLKYLDDFYEEINEPNTIKKHFTAGRTKN